MIIAYKEEVFTLELPNYLTKEQLNAIKSAMKRKAPILVTGEQGPTGKTTLTDLLKDRGAIAFEPHECLIIDLNERLF